MRPWMLQLSRASDKQRLQVQVASQQGAVDFCRGPRLVLNVVDPEPQPDQK
ncbi:hypothetical protein XM38_042090 [Halomicronema hongdechloris C2206]|uniref:Uncharacterized protein n=2 Tax=Halomicronema hongdechloris TaxID=1209493 RepID=A0A1Z3HSY6_9CYAN|nr:hypothetical protein XM38_042090 [Halomicronema hongdechloris C2206]